MTITSVLLKGRLAFEARMRGTCVIRRPLPDEVEEDPLTGVVTPAYEVVDPYEGKCYLRYPGLAYESNPEAGGFNFAVSRIVLRIPFGPVVNPGDVITITEEPDNPQLVGTVLRVASVDDMSQATAQRLLCEDFQVGTNR